MSKVVEPEALLSRALALASEIAALPGPAVQLTCEALRRGLDLGVDASARVGADAFGLVAATEEFREGTRAFLEKWPPRFEGASSGSRAPQGEGPGAAFRG